MKSIGKILLASILGGAITLGVYKVFLEKPEVRTYIESKTENPVKRTNYTPLEKNSFTKAAEKTVNSVVHVKTKVNVDRQRPQSPLEYFFGHPRRQQSPRFQLGSGSGVIISEDGYIVTNNHVVQNAEKIVVSLNNEEQYEASVVGTDPTTDIALLKIDVEGLPYLEFSNSDKVKVGEWVLAVGNPFNLTSTVTAGIVSATGRNIGIIDKKTAIESFIQTDAAVNRGNSGGALVNTQGDLIGINSAISSHTGSFEGYAFAIPANIAQKVVKDLKEYGRVQRAFLGVSIADLNPRIAEAKDLEVEKGVYIAGLTQNGAAQAAGLQQGDVILSVNDQKVNKSSALQELIGRKRPGENVKVTVMRDDEKITFDLELRNIQGTTETLKKEDMEFLTMLGGSFRPLKEDEKQALNISHGVVITNVKSGILQEQNIPRGYVISHINRQEIHNVEDINEAVNNLSKGDYVVLEGFLPNGRHKYFPFGF